MKIKLIKIRNWDMVSFDRSRIERAIEKATEVIWSIDYTFIDAVVDNIINEIKKRILSSDWEYIVNIEEVQDLVEQELMESGHFDIAKQYIIYRDERKKARDKASEAVEKKLEKHTLKITKTNWKKEIFDIEKIRDTYKRVSYKLARKCRFEEFEESLRKYIVEWIKTSDINKMMIKSAIDLVSVQNTSWEFIAWRLFTIDIYKKASINRWVKINDFYKPKVYKALFDEYIE